MTINSVDPQHRSQYRLSKPSGFRTTSFEKVPWSGCHQLKSLKSAILSHPCESLAATEMCEEFGLRSFERDFEIVGV